jgi:hypothetical protein
MEMRRRVNSQVSRHGERAKTMPLEAEWPAAHPRRKICGATTT